MLLETYRKSNGYGGDDNSAVIIAQFIKVAMRIMRIMPYIYKLKGWTHKGGHKTCG